MIQNSIKYFRPYDILRCPKDDLRYNLKASYYNN